MEKFFKLKENHTTISTEITAGITTFFAMAYIIAVNPSVLSATGMEWGAVFLATIIAAIIGTLIMGLFANVPYAQAPGMGLNLYGMFRSRLYLAAGHVDGLHLRPSEHPDHCHKNPQDRDQSDPPISAAGNQRRYRSIYRLPGIPECGRRTVQP